MPTLTATDTPETWVKKTHTEPPDPDETSGTYPHAVRWALDVMRWLDHPAITRVVKVADLPPEDIPTTAPHAEHGQPRTRRDRRTNVLDAVADVERIFDLPRTEVLRIGGVQERTFYTWTEGVTPQPRTIRQLRRLHAIARVVEQRLGVNTVDWFDAGDPTPHDLLVGGDLDTVERIVRQLGRYVDRSNPFKAAGVFDDDIA